MPCGGGGNWKFGGRPPGGGNWKLGGRPPGGGNGSPPGKGGMGGIPRPPGGGIKPFGGGIPGMPGMGGIPGRPGIPNGGGGTPLLDVSTVLYCFSWRMGMCGVMRWRGRTSREGEWWRGVNAWVLSEHRV